MRGTVSKIFDNGKRISFYMQGVDGSISTFDRNFAQVKEGDSIEYETVQKGQYTNLAHGWKVQTTMETGGAGDTTTQRSNNKNASRDDAILAQVAFKKAVDYVCATNLTSVDVQNVASKFLGILKELIHGPKEIEEEKEIAVEPNYIEMTMADALIQFIKDCAKNLGYSEVVGVAKEVGLVKRIRTLEGLYEKVEDLDFNDQEVMDKVAELKKKLTEMRI